MGQEKLHRLLLESTERAPDAPAYAGVRYGELAGRAARVAGVLRDTGVRRGARVVLALDGCVEYLVAYYGTLMAGATVVPLGPDTRPTALGHALKHSEAVALIAAGPALTQLDEIDPFPGRLRASLSVGDRATDRPGAVESIDFAAAEREGAELYDAGAHGADLASVSYTSGTTGTPKGVMLSHRNLVSNTRSIIEYLELSARDRVAMVLPYYYVYGNSVLHTHLAVGGSIVDAGSIAFPVRVLEIVRDEGCTGLSGVPSTFGTLLRVRDLGAYDLSSLRYLTQAGGPMTPSLTRRVRAAFPETKLFVMYGQTEASARLSYLPPDEIDRKVGSVGIPIPGVTLSVVDASGVPVPTGTVGEIVAAGPNVMVGYLGEPVATARTLRGGTLHTGDMGYLDPEGYLYISGRDSEMINSGGHRIGPREIEDVVSALPGVAECAVVGVEDELLGQRIVAVVVLRSNESADPRLIQRACLAVLPRYKVPSEVHVAAELPHSARGKLLRAVVRERLESERAAVPLAADRDRDPPDDHAVLKRRHPRPPPSGPSSPETPR